MSKYYPHKDNVLSMSSINVKVPCGVNINKCEIFKLKQKGRSSCLKFIHNRAASAASHPIQGAAACIMNSTPLGQFYCPSRSPLLRWQRRREAFSGAEGEHSGLLSALEMAQEDQGETPSQLSVPTMYTRARCIMAGKEGAKVVPLDNNRRLSPRRSKCARQSGS